MKVLAPHSDFSTTTPVGEKEHFVTAGQASKPRLPIKPLLMGVVGDGATVFCGVRLDLGGYCLKVSVLPGCPFPGPLAREYKLFVQLFLSLPTGISGLLASPALSIGYINQKENPENLLLGCFHDS